MPETATPRLSADAGWLARAERPFSLGVIPTIRLIVAILLIGTALLG